MVSNGVANGRGNECGSKEVNRDGPLQYPLLDLNGSEKEGEVEMGEQDEVTAKNLTQYESSSNLTNCGRRTSSDEDAPVPWRNYVGVIILFLINLLNYMDQFAFSGLVTELHMFFDMKDAEWDLLQLVHLLICGYLGTRVNETICFYMVFVAFICCYIVFALMCGYLGDRYNRKLIMTVGIVIWSGAMITSTFMPGQHFMLFQVCRGMGGIGKLSYLIVAPTLIADMFTGRMRSRMLMLFFSAIPVGSGLGFIVSSNVANLTGQWQWGVRVTPILGVVCLLLLIFVLREPERGEAEHAHVERTTFWQDTMELAHNRTYVYSTVGFTLVVFVMSSVSWWTPTAVEHALAMNNEKAIHETAKIALVFGVITCLASLLGLACGSMASQLWSDGKLYFTRFKNPRADPHVCAFGSLVAVPFLFVALQSIPSSLTFAWVLIFIAVTLMCLNWVVIVDMLLYIVVPTRRATANAFQILVSDLLGSYASPYLIELVSDKLCGSDHSAAAHFYSVQHALYIPNLMLVISGVCFLIAALYVVDDRRKAIEDAIHGVSVTNWSRSTKSYEQSDMEPLIDDDGLNVTISYVTDTDNITISQRNCNES